jgi:DNA-binding response OmpR family regulator
MRHPGGSILVVEDDKKTSALVRLYLENAGFEVSEAADGRQALAAARQRRPDLVVLDVMLPEIDGLAVCRALRTQSGVPVILLSARTTEEDKLRGLDLGADDYVTKPFSPRELVARVRTVLRRAPPGEEPTAAAVLRFGGLVLDTGRRALELDGRPVAVTPSELRLLEILARAAGRAFTRAELVERAFGWDYEGLERTVDVHVKNLRRKLRLESGGDGPWIETVWGIGYRFVGEPA